MRLDAHMACGHIVSLPHVKERKEGRADGLGQATVLPLANARILACRLKWNTCLFWNSAVAFKSDPCSFVVGLYWEQLQNSAYLYCSVFVLTSQTKAQE